MTDDRHAQPGLAVMIALRVSARPGVAVLPGPDWCMPRAAADPQSESARQDYLRPLPGLLPLPRHDVGDLS